MVRWPGGALELGPRTHAPRNSSHRPSPTSSAGDSRLARAPSGPVTYRLDRRSRRLSASQAGRRRRLARRGLPWSLCLWWRRRRPWHRIPRSMVPYKVVGGGRCAPARDPTSTGCLLFSTTLPPQQRPRSDSSPRTIEKSLSRVRIRSSGHNRRPGKAQPSTLFLQSLHTVFAGAPGSHERAEPGLFVDQGWVFGRSRGGNKTTETKRHHRRNKHGQSSWSRTRGEEVAS